MATPSSKSKTNGRPVPVIPPDAPENANGKPLQSHGGSPIVKQQRPPFPPSSVLKPSTPPSMDHTQGCVPILIAIGAVEAKLDSDSDSGGGGRRHVSASVPKTRLIPSSSSERTAMEQLRQRITFSAQSSAVSTPQKSNQPLPHPKSCPPTTTSARPEVTATFAPVTAGGEDGEASDYFSEGEITSSASISTLLSQLDTIKNYLKEAESLHKQLQPRISEPGVLTQITKINRLIVDLRRKESAYLSQLLKIMGKEESASSTRPQVGTETTEEGGSEFSEDESTSGGEESEAEGDQGTPGGVASGAPANDSLSLKAEVEQEELLAEHRKRQQQEEITTLQEQQALLRKILLQQKQIEELEARQASLHLQKKEAETKLVEAETKQKELEQEAAAFSAVETDVPAELELVDEEDDDEQDEATEDARQELVAKLTELKTRKAHVEQLISLLSALKKTKTEEMESATRGSDEVASPTDVTGAKPQCSGKQGAQPALDLAGSSELVAEGGRVPPPSITDMEEKLRQAEEARKKLRELQEMMVLLQGMSLDASYSEGSASSQPSPQKTSPGQRQSRSGAGPHTKDRGHEDAKQQLMRKMASVQKKFLGSTPPVVAVNSSDEEYSEDEEEGEESSLPDLDTTHSETKDGTENILERSLMEDYQRKVTEKKLAVVRLQKQRDELLATQRRLQQLKILRDQESAALAKQESEASKPKDDEAMPSHLVAELERQRKLYNELLHKTQQLRKLQTDIMEGDHDGKDSDHDTYSVTSSTRMFPETDLTAATWGGSTVQSESNSSVNLDDTQESLEPAATQAFGGSASVEHPSCVTEDEKLQFTVTRHTPRGHRRVLTPTEDPLVSARKKMKLDMPSPSRKPHTYAAAATAVSMVTIPGTGTVVTTYSTVAESVAPNRTMVTLHGRDLWAKFHKATTEMMITKTGRRMFPVLKISVSGLEPDASYIIVLDIVRVSNDRYKFDDNTWVKTGLQSPALSGRLYVHPDSPATGATWEKQVISFQKLKITSNHLDQQEGYIILDPMYKYQPRVHIVKSGDDAALSTQQEDSMSTHIFTETQFMGVTVYQNQHMTQLKIKYNPYTKGQRWSETRRGGAGESFHSGTSYPPSFDPTSSPDSRAQLPTGDREGYQPDASTVLHTGASGDEVSQPQRPSMATSNYSAVWPGVIFPSSHASRRLTRDDGTQTTPPMTSGTLPQPNPEQLYEQHIAVLEQQLAMASNMCSELLQGQNALIHCLCQRADTVEVGSSIQERLAHLHQYHMELDQYYQAAYQMYEQITEPRDLSEEQDHEREEEPTSQASRVREMEPSEASATAGGDGGDSSSAGPTDPLEQSQLRQQPRPHVPPPPPPPSSFYPGVYGGNYGFSPRRTSQQDPTGPAEPDLQYHHQPQVTTDRETTHSQPSQPDAAPPPPPFQFTGFNVPSTTPAFYNLPGFNAPPTTPAYFPLFSSSHYSPYGPPPLGASPRQGTLSAHPSPFKQREGYFSPQRFGWLYPPPTGYTPQFGYPYPPRPGVPSSPYHYGRYDMGPRITVSEAEPYPSLLRSPSGITAASMQVQPPSSPPSAPSVNNVQQHSCTNFSTQDQQAPVSYSPISTGSTLHGVSAPPMDEATTISAQLNLTTVGVTLPSTASTSTTVTGKSFQPSSKAASLAQKGRQAAMAELKQNIATSGASALLTDSQMKDKDGNTQQETESISSLPLSIPEELAGTQVLAEPPSDFSVFDALRDTIYTEVATLIATNESRPHFLVELFRELQMLSTDYLRQRALYNLQDLVTRFLTEDNVEEDRTKKQYQSWMGSTSENTPSESAMTSDDEAKPPHKPHVPPSSNLGFDYVEAVESGSSVSTPSLPDDEPFASDNLGDTVIKLDKTLAKMRESYSSGASPKMNPPVVSPGPPPPGDHVSDSSQSDVAPPSDFDTQVLDQQIKSIMTEVIPILKQHLQSNCSSDLLNHIREYVMSLVLLQEKDQPQGFIQILTGQLDASLNAALAKYLNRKLRECGEDLLVDISEVLFNELAFFKLMHNVQMNGPGHDFGSMSQTTTENEAEDHTHPRTAPPTKPLPLDPSVVQALGIMVTRTLQEEEEALGKSRDDELAQTWDTSIKEQPSLANAEDEQSFQLELSASELKPINSAGSGEEDQPGSGEEDQLGNGEEGQLGSGEEGQPGSQEEGQPRSAEEGQPGSGEEGQPGSQEEEGQPGSGEVGQPGSQGEVGQPGSGEVGQPGSQGEEGQPGSQGEEGQPGSGEEGQPGSQGEEGQPGSQGEEGQPGSQGEEGQPGSGEEGQPGSQGEDQPTSQDQLPKENSKEPTPIPTTPPTETPVVVPVDAGEEPQGKQSPEAKDEVKGVEHSESTSGSPQLGSEKEVELGAPSTNGTGEGEKAALEAQMKVEQQATEGLVGILASIEQGQELAGDGGILPEPVTAEP